MTVRVSIPGGDARKLAAPPTPRPACSIAGDAMADAPGSQELANQFAVEFR